VPLLTSISSSPPPTTTFSAPPLLKGTAFALLANNHLIAADAGMLTFDLDQGTDRLFAVGDCGYAPGFSSVDLRDGGIAAPSGTPDEWQWITTPIAAATVQLTPGLCGPRLAVGIPPLVIIGRSGYHPFALLFVDSRTGQVLRTVPLAAEPLDVTAHRSDGQP
jgi:hypothetical protein